MPDFVAPAARPLRWLHIAEAGADLAAEHDMEPLTLCGLPMCSWDLWCYVERRPGDRLCPVCADEAGLMETVRIPEIIQLPLEPEGAVG